MNLEEKLAKMEHPVALCVPELEQEVQFLVPGVEVKTSAYCPPGYIYLIDGKLLEPTPGWAFNVDPLWDGR